MTGASKKWDIRIVLLHILSVLAVNAFIYAGFSMLRATIFHDDGGAAAIILYVVIICFAHAAGKFFSSGNRLKAERLINTKFFRFFTFMLNIQDGAAFISSFAMWGMILIPIAAAFVLYGRHGLLRSLFEVLPAAVAYIVSLKQSRLEAAQIAGKSSMITGLATMVICLELPLIITRLDYLRPWYFAVSYFMIFAFIIVKNQEDIDTHIFRKKHVDKSVLPRNLRRFNMLSASFVFALMILLFNLKKVVVYILNILNQIIRYIFSLFMGLVENLISDSDPAASPGLSEMPEMSAQRPMPMLNFMFNVIMYFIILYAAYKILFAVGIRLPGVFSKILSMLKKLFKMNKSTEYYEKTDYVDLTETVLPSVRDTGNKKKRKKSRLKKLSKITDPVEKVRHMYGNILGTLPLYGIDPKQADTTTEILAKASRAPQVKEGLSPLTNIYEQVRYGEMVPDGDTLAQAERCYSSITDIK